MNFDQLYEKIQDGSITKEEAHKLVSLNWLETAAGSIYDVSRGVRNNIPEIIYGEFKTKEQVIDLVEHALKQHQQVLISRSLHTDQIIDFVGEKYPILEGERVLYIGELPSLNGSVLVVSAGAADHPVVEEIQIVIKALGVRPIVFEDRGIAHPTRVLEAVKRGVEEDMKAVVVVAGMEGALAPFVSSMVAVPVIGVPTSVGYGYKANESALISMLASCAPNLAVVNIDGGLRAAVISALIVKNSQ